MNNPKSRYDEATQIFSDMKDFFHSEDKLHYLKAIIPANDIVSILDDLTVCFLETEDYEKCETIKQWKQMMLRKTVETEDLSE